MGYLFGVINSQVWVFIWHYRPVKNHQLYAISIHSGWKVLEGLISTSVPVPLHSPQLCMFFPQTVCPH